MFLCSRLLPATSDLFLPLSIFMPFHTFCLIRLPSFSVIPLTIIELSKIFVIFQFLSFRLLIESTFKNQIMRPRERIARYVADRMEIGWRLPSWITRSSTNLQQNEKTVNFSKINLLASCGLLDRKFNFETLEFESSLRHRLWSLLVLIVQETYSISLYASNFFAREDPIQLLLGSPYVYIEEGLTRSVMGTVGLIAVSA